jgi:hypothetical protein
MGVLDDIQRCMSVVFMSVGVREIDVVAYEKCRTGGIEQKMENKEAATKLSISRRQFMQGAGVLALAGVAGLAGCKAETVRVAVSSTPPVTITTTATATVTATKTVTSTPTATTPPPTTNAVNWPMDIIGKFTVSPAKAPIGASVTASGTGFKAGTSYDLMWQDVVGSWKVSNGEFYGREFIENWIKLGTINTDAQGAFSISFTIPEGFGFTHDLVVLESGVVRNKLGFKVLMQVTLSPAQGVVGSPITIDVKGMGWRDYENGWHVHYDNIETGDITTTTTHGMGKAVISATGALGKHIIRVIEGAYTVAYQNHEECPFPDTPTFNLEYTLVSGGPVMSPAYSAQALPVEKAVAPAPTGNPQIWTDVVRAPVGTPVKVSGAQLPPNTSVDLYYYSLSGNRVSGGGWEEVKTAFDTVKTDAKGTFVLDTAFPDTIGGDRRLEAYVNEVKLAETSFNIAPSIISMEPISGPVGTVAHFIVKGLSWTVTAKDYYIAYDNSKIGYSCAMTSKGTINVFLPMAGTPGWHFIDFWPGIYKGTDPAKIEQYRSPLLALADHPGEVCPAFHFAFEITG